MGEGGREWGGEPETTHFGGDGSAAFDAAGDAAAALLPGNIPNPNYVPNIRLGRKRWIAIVDRSWSNDVSKPPRILAIRDLPN